MLCVEAAVATAPIKLASGEEWWGRQTLIACEGPSPDLAAPHGLRSL
jgi:hypothetical protein